VPPELKEGVCGNYYLKRAIVNTQLGLGANLPEDAIYPINIADETGKPLDGGSAYVLHFDRGATPPANTFWSVTLYDAQGYQVVNSLNRFAVRLAMARCLLDAAWRTGQVIFSSGSSDRGTETNTLTPITRTSAQQPR
jgi:hypothetical protein